MDLEALLAALGEQLPATVDELSTLLSATTPQINLIRAQVDAGVQLSSDQLATLRTLVDGRDAIQTEIDNVALAEQQHRDELAQLLARTDLKEAPVEEAPIDEIEDAEIEDIQDTESVDELPIEVPDDISELTEDIIEGEVVVADAKVPARQSGNRPVNFSGLGNDQAPVTPVGPAWRMRAGAPGYTEGPVSFAQLAQAVDGITKGTRTARSFTGEGRGAHMAQVLAEVRRDLPLVNDPHQLIAEIERVTTTVPTQRGSDTRVPVTADSLVAAGGWCSPSEILYDFCDVPNATDLISVPEITISRGGVRWPSEPDMTEVFENFEFFFTEPELEADPAPVKECIEIPCPTEFEEMRLAVVGYCVSAGILQTQGWPELIEWFMQQLVAEHLRAISRRTILDMVNDSTLQTFSDANTIGSSGAVLNSLDLMATNIRLNRGLPRNATIEGVAPSWLLAVIRADWAYRGSEVLNSSVTDAQIQQWLAARNIALQFVGDWQSRGTAQPGRLDTLRWPGHVDVLLYPAGTWFRAMQNVIEIGIMYPKEQLVLNRYTRMFTEDAIAVGRRCHPSTVVRIPLAVDGAIGARETVTYSDTTVGSGQSFGSLYGAPQSGGQAGAARVTSTLTETGSPTGGTVKLTLTPGGQTGTIPFNATAVEVREALASLGSYNESDFLVTGGPLNSAAIVVKHPTGTALTVTSPSLTGGTSPAVTKS